VGIKRYSRPESGTGSAGQSPGTSTHGAWIAGENAKPGLILRADGQQSVSRGQAGLSPRLPREPLCATRPPVNLFAALSFLLARDPRVPLGAIPPVGKLRSRFTPSRPCRYRIKVAMRLHHYRFLERAIVRVLIATLWQIGYTVNHNVRVAQIKPDERYKEGAIFHRPRARPRQAGGRAMWGWGPGGRTL
jgi:hypothetical protein